MRNRNFENYLIDNIWYNKRNNSTFKIYSIKTDSGYYFDFNGLISKFIQVPNSLKISADEVQTILFEGNYEITKYLFLNLICSDILSSENLCEEDSYNKIKNVFEIINN